MFKNVDELKAFIQWAKAEQVQSFSVGDVKIDISPIFFTEQLLNPPTSNSEPTMKPSSKRWLEDPEAVKDDDELLYWSSGD